MSVKTAAEARALVAASVEPALVQQFEALMSEVTHAAVHGQCLQAVRNPSESLRRKCEAAGFQWIYTPSFEDEPATTFIRW